MPEVMEMTIDPEVINTKGWRGDTYFEKKKPSENGSLYWISSHREMTNWLLTFLFLRYNQIPKQTSISFLNSHV